MKLLTKTELALPHTSTCEIFLLLHRLHLFQILMNVKITGKIYVQMNASTHLVPLPATVAYQATWIVQQTSSVRVR